MRPHQFPTKSFYFGRLSHLIWYHSSSFWCSFMNTEQPQWVTTTEKNEKKETMHTTVTKTIHGHCCHHQNFSEIKLSKGQKMLSIIFSIHRCFSFFHLFGFVCGITIKWMDNERRSIVAYIYVRTMTIYILHLCLL